MHSLLWDQIKNAEWGRSSQFSVKIMNGNLEVGHLGNFPKERETIQKIHYENKFTKTLRPTDILHIFTKF